MLPEDACGGRQQAAADPAEAALASHVQGRAVSFSIAAQYPAPPDEERYDGTGRTRTGIAAKIG